MVVWSQQALIAALGVSLAHSLWQGALLGSVGMMLSARLKRVPPDVRHGIYGLLLLTIFVAWLASLGCLYTAEVRFTPLPSVAHGPAPIPTQHDLSGPLE